MGKVKVVQLVLWGEAGSQLGHASARVFGSSEGRAENVGGVEHGVVGPLRVGVVGGASDSNDPEGVPVRHPVISIHCILHGISTCF